MPSPAQSPSSPVSPEEAVRRVARARDTLVAEVTALTEAGMGVKDACARVIAAHPGAPSRRELYQAVLAALD